TTSGKVFFWSTVGSITGSLMAGFVLIPRFGLDSIMLGTGSVLALLGAIGFATNGGRKPGTATIAGLALVMSIGAALAAPGKKPGVLHDTNGLYEHITVQDLPYKGRPARVLLQDRAVSGLIYLDNSESVDYAKYPP